MSAPFFALADSRRGVDFSAERVFLNPVGDERPRRPDERGRCRGEGGTIVRFVDNEQMASSFLNSWRRSRSEWIAGATRAWTRAGADNVSLVAAGVAFYAFSAIVPMLAAIVLTYGLVADAQTVAANIRSLTEVLPADAANIIGEQLIRIVGSSQDSKGLGLVVALGVALYGATKGTSAMTIALNIAYRVDEGRGFVMLRVVAFAMVVGAVVLVLSGMATTTVLAFLTNLLPWTPTALLTAIRFGGYLLLALLAITGAAALYRFAPNREDAPWVWLSPGAVLATLLWLGATALFGIYAANVADYGATYGSLSAIIVLLTWLWLSAYVFLLGGELNAALDLTPEASSEDNDDPPPVAQRHGLVRTAAGVVLAFALLKVTKGRE